MKSYIEFFGLRDDPFKITPDSYYFFLSEAHQEALSSLHYLVESEEGFAVIVGEPGTGKTLTVRKFVEELPKNVRYAYILFPNLSPQELFEAILEDFGIKSEGETKNRLFGKLRDYLIENRKKGNKVIIIIDEAQNLPVETLEELRILSNLETSDQKLLQIILLGQPELEDKLNSEELRQLKQRITVLCRLRNFTEKETKAYIDYRIAKAGFGNLKLSAGVYSLVYKHSLGIPRLINIIMERAMMAAYMDSSHEIKKEHVRRAIQSVGLRMDEKEIHLKPVYILPFILFFIALSYLIYTLVPKIDVKQHSGNTAVVNVHMLNIRKSPSHNAPIIYVLSRGAELEVLAEGPDGWLKVKHGNITGWIKGKYVSIK